MNNIHGRRINHDRLVRKGSGYTATHAPDVMRAADPWFVGVTLAYGPDGGVYVSDFSDTGECHHTRNTQKHTGRIYKITYGKPKPWRGDIGKLGEKELMALQTHQNEWFARHARRVMQERFAVELEWARQRRGSKPPLKYFHLLPYLPLEEAKLKQLTRKVDRESWKKPLWDTFERGKNDAHRLRSMWALHVIGALTGSGALEDLLRDKSEHLRAWAIQLLCENKKPSAAARAEFARMAREDKSPLVRLYLASAMQRLPVAQRVPVLTHLLAHAEDAPDQNLPLMYWYATEPVVAADKKAALQLLSVCKIPKVRQFITRRMATGRDAGKKE
jgi:hypothetical protein